MKLQPGSLPRLQGRGQERLMSVIPTVLQPQPHPVPGWE